MSIRLACRACGQIYELGAGHECQRRRLAEKPEGKPESNHEHVTRTSRVTTPGYVTRDEFEAVLERLARLEELLGQRAQPKRDRAAYMREYRAKRKA